LALGEWVLRQACEEAARWGDGLTVAINLSAVQLSQASLPESVAQTLLETGLAPRRLELEITETAIIADKPRALHILRRLKAMGIAIAIDDFGTGYSSLDTLNSFPFDKIKIDKSFVIGSEERPQARAIIRAVLALGHSLGVPVLAEGVETSGHVDLLVAEGCDQVQGYLFGRPGHAPSLLARAGPTGRRLIRRYVAQRRGSVASVLRARCRKRGRTVPLAAKLSVEKGLRAEAAAPFAKLPYLSATRCYSEFASFCPYITSFPTLKS
jgi:EAL domain-containing protein (putative c-di-GMP-specific phosphodiesterase class I)